MRIALPGNSSLSFSQFLDLARVLLDEGEAVEAWLDLQGDPCRAIQEPLHLRLG